MAKFLSVSHLIVLWACIYSLAFCQAQTQDTDSSRIQDNETCASDDLNHSLLVECSASSCSNPSSSGSGVDEITWPTSQDEIILVQSTRAGERFSQIKLPNLMVTEDHMTKLLNINTTLNVESDVSSDAAAQKLEGFGATLDAIDIARALDQNLFERLYCLVLDDLFGLTSSSARLNLLRLYIGEDFISSGQHNLSSILLALDRQPKQHSVSSRVKIKLVIEFHDDIETSILKNQIEAVAQVKASLTNVEIWTMSFRKVDTEIGRLVNQMLPGTLLFTSTKVSTAHYVYNELSGGAQKNLLLHTEPSVPYDAIEDLGRKTDAALLTVGYAQPKTKDYGDWNNAYQLAVQISNNLQHGSRGYIEDLSVIDVLAATSSTSTSRDASLYSLHQSHGVHFKGPRFYAMGHYSRYLKPGANRLKVDLFTQPNMFAAHYSAYITSDREHLVAIVLNDNEHLLPFRLSYDQVVMAFANLESKSFNTFLIKLKKNVH